jgi:hypothetical protein
VCRKQENCPQELFFHSEATISTSFQKNISIHHRTLVYQRKTSTLAVFHISTGFSPCFLWLHIKEILMLGNIFFFYKKKSIRST